MKRLVIIAILALIPAAAFGQVNAGSFLDGDTLYIYATTNDVSTGGKSDADSAPAYECYTAESGTNWATGSMAALDDAGTTGLYSEAISTTSLSQGNVGICYITATVDAIDGHTYVYFQIGESVNAALLEDADFSDTLDARIAAAIVLYHLDHLLAADYDPASKPGVSTALLNELVGNDAGVSRFTANTLELAPTSSAANLDTIVSGTAFPNFPIWGFNSDNDPVTGVSDWTCYVSQNGGTGSVTTDTTEAEVDSANIPGLYVVDLSAAETTANILVVSCTGTNVVPYNTVITPQH